MVENNNSVVPKITEKRFGCMQVFGLIVVAVIITAGTTVFIFKTYFFPSAFKPVTLNPHEEQVLTAKLKKLDTLPSKADRFDSSGALEPEPYSEKNAKREIIFTDWKTFSDGVEDIKVKKGQLKITLKE